VPRTPYQVYVIRPLLTAFWR